MLDWLGKHKESVMIITAVVGGLFAAVLWLDNKIDFVNERIDAVNERIDAGNERIDAGNERFDKVYEIIINQQGQISDSEATIDTFIREHENTHDTLVDMVSDENENTTK